MIITPRYLLEVDSFGTFLDEEMESHFIESYPLDTSITVTKEFLDQIKEHYDVSPCLLTDLLLPSEERKYYAECEDVKAPWYKKLREKHEAKKYQEIRHALFAEIDALATKYLVESKAQHTLIL